MRLKTGIMAVLLSLPLLLCPVSRAFAVNATSGNFEFIEAAASESGLETGDLIATMIANLTAVTGVGFANGGLEGAAIALGNTAADNLNALGDAADYPAWDTLDMSQQTSWGTKQNYDAAKFNSLMTAFGLGGSRDSFISSGGANFEWTEDAKDKLDAIGNIGRNWVSGAGNALSDLFSVVNDTQPAVSFADVHTTVMVDGSQVENWPSTFPQYVYVSYGTLLHMIYSGTSLNNNHAWFNSSNAVYYIPYVSTNRIGCRNFSLLPYNYGYFTSVNAIPPIDTAARFYSNSETYQGGTYGAVNGVVVNSSTMQVNTFTNTQIDNIDRLIAALVQSGQIGDLGTYDPIESYPEDIDQESDEPIYFPSGGITPIINWGDFITNNPSGGDVDLSEIVALLQQFKFYATGQLKVHDEGVYDNLTDLGTLLTGIDDTLKQVLAKIGLGTDSNQLIEDFDYPEFDEKATDLVETISDLAPFGTLLLISAMVDTMAATGKVNDPSLVVPFQFMPGSDFSVTLDLSWLDPLRPVINAFMISILIMTLAAVTLRFVELEAAA